jgi:hypothetical protein
MRITGKSLRQKWNIPAKEVFHHQGGSFFMPLSRFPGAFCDRNGYLLFGDRNAYESSEYLRIGKRVNLRTALSKIPGYVRCGD